MFEELPISKRQVTPPCLRLGFGIQQPIKRKSMNIKHYLVIQIIFIAIWTGGAQNIKPEKPLNYKESKELLREYYFVRCLEHGLGVENVRGRD